MTEYNPIYEIYAHTAYLVMVIAYWFIFMPSIQPSEGFPYLLVSIILVGLYYIILMRKSEDAAKLERDRSEWLYSLLDRSLDPEGTEKVSTKNEWHLREITGSLSQKTMGFRELGLREEPTTPNLAPPDLLASEKELVKIEERASFLIGTSVLLPVIFALMHIFSKVSLPVFLFEMQIVFILAQFVARTQKINYDLNGWKELYPKLEEYRDRLPVDGRKAIIGDLDLLAEPFNNELGLRVVVNSEHNASKSISNALLTITQLPVAKRIPALNLYMDMVEKLPVQQQIVETRWRAYKARLLLITTMAVLTGGLLASISQIQFSTFDGILLIESTPYLQVGMGIITLAINWLITKNWLNTKEQMRWLGIWFVLYWITSVLGVAFFAI